MILSSTGQDLLAGATGPIQIVGNKMLIPVNNTTGDLAAPQFFFIDDFRNAFISDLANTVPPTDDSFGSLANSAGNTSQAGQPISNVPNFVNVAANSGLIQIRENDNNPGDGRLDHVAPGVIPIDLSLTTVNGGNIAGIAVTGITAPSLYPDGLTSAITPVVTLPAGGPSFPVGLGNKLAQAQLHFVALTPGEYKVDVTLTFNTTATGVPIGLAQVAGGGLRRTFTVSIDQQAPGVFLNPGPLVVAQPVSSLTPVTVDLDATQSTDPNGVHLKVPTPILGTQGLQYQWSISDPLNLTLPPGDASKVSHVPLQITNSTPPGIYKASVVVAAGPQVGAPTAKGEVTIIVQAPNNSGFIPSVDASVDRVARTGDLVTLDANDGTKDMATAVFTTRQVGGSHVDLTHPADQPTQTQFTAPAAQGVYTFETTARFHALTSPTSTTHVIVINDLGTGGDLRPAGSAIKVTGGTIVEGEGAVGRVREPITLSAANSQALPRVGSYLWQQTAGPLVDVNLAGDSMTFVPVMPGNYGFRVTAFSPENVAGLPADVSVQVVDPTDPTELLAPHAVVHVASAQIVPGSDPALIDLALSGDTVVTLDAAGSTASDGTTGHLKYFWSQTSGPLVPQDFPSFTQSLTAPAIDVIISSNATQRTGAYEFVLTLVDTVNLTTDRTIVRFVAERTSAKDIVPLAVFHAITNATSTSTPIHVGDSVSLDGSASKDSQGNALEYTFEEITGLPTKLGGGTASIQTVVPFAAGDYTFSLTVFDTTTKHRSAPVTQSFHVEGQNRPGAVVVVTNPGTTGGSSGSSSSSSSGCAFGGAQEDGAAAGALLPIAALVAVLGLRRRLAPVVALARRVPRAAVWLGVSALAVFGSGCAAGIIIPVAIALSAGGGGSTPRTNFPDVTVSGVVAPRDALLRTVAAVTGTAQKQFVTFEGDGAILASVQNSGDDAISGLQLSFYLSPEKVLTTDSFRVRTEDVKATLQPGEFVRVRSLEPAPADQKEIADNDSGHSLTLGEGRYYLIAKVNDPSAQQEKNTEADGDGSKNNTFFTGIVVELREPTSMPAAGALDLAVTKVAVPTQVIAGQTVAGAFVVTNFRAPVATTVSGTFKVRISETEVPDLAHDPQVGSGSFTLAPGATLTAYPQDFTFNVSASDLAAFNIVGTSSIGQLFVSVEVTPATATADSVVDNDVRAADTATFFYQNSQLASNGATLPVVNPSNPGADPLVLDITTQRPAISTSLIAGEQRILAFSLPQTGLSVLRSQALITVRSVNFDPIVELLSPAGSSMQVVDDSPISSNDSHDNSIRSVLYASLAASPSNATFFLVISAASATDSGAFTVHVDVNSASTTDVAGTTAVSIGDIQSLTPLALENTELGKKGQLVQPFQFNSFTSEFLFTVPAPGFFPLSVRLPPGTPVTATAVHIDPVSTSLVSFDETGTPTEIPLAVEADPNPANGASFLLLATDQPDGRFALPAGEYVLVVRLEDLPVPLDFGFQLVIGTPLQVPDPTDEELQQAPGLKYDRTVH